MIVVGMRCWRSQVVGLAMFALFAASVPANADEVPQGKVVITCAYNNGSEDYTLDFDTKAAAEHNNVGGWTRQGTISQVTDDSVVFYIGTEAHNTTFTLNRYSLQLSRRQDTGSADDPSLGFGDEAPVPCRRQQRQL